jgi:nicotinamide-nucleotide adenylyltransferase
VGRALLIGRFQPFHRGHLAVVEEVRRKRPEESLLLGVGSAQASYTFDNPFTAGERLEMIERALTEAKILGWSSSPIPDIHRHDLWVAHVTSLVPKFERIYTNNPLTRLLFERSGYVVESPRLVERARFQGAFIRSTIREEKPWRSLVPESVANYLEVIGGVDRIRMLASHDTSDSAAVSP